MERLEEDFDFDLGFLLRSVEGSIWEKLSKASCLDCESLEGVGLDMFYLEEGRRRSGLSDGVDDTLEIATSFRAYKNGVPTSDCDSFCVTRQPSSAGFVFFLLFVEGLSLSFLVRVESVEDLTD